MHEVCYAIEQFKSQWVVSVGGARVLTSKSKWMALEAARRATVLLRQNHCADACRDGLAHGGGGSPMERAAAVVTLSRSA
ncbi:MAG TPA: hypothetical protein VGI22_14650 [Xanthobacteraceae bacterium]|jgi:hypothetical protein